MTGRLIVFSYRQVLKMSRSRIAAVVVTTLTLLSTSVLAVTVEGVPNPRSVGSWVYDGAGMLSADTEDQIDNILDELEEDTDAEVAVVTVVSADAATPRDFATDLFNHWGIGKADVDNGLLILMVEDERRLEMETGYGMEPVLPDGWLMRMQQDDMVPHFRDGDFDTGILRGVERTADRIREHQDYIGSDVDAPGGRADSFDWNMRDSLICGMPILIVVLFGLGIFYGWRRKRLCPHCNQRMRRKPISGLADIPHLTRGQEIERALGTMRHHIYQCEDCTHYEVLSSAPFLNRSSDCPQCGYRTVATDSTVVESATRTSEGLREVTEECQDPRCDYEKEYTRSIPRIRSSSSTTSSGGSFSSGGFSSSGGSSGGSFGGGSSGGGGAGSSW